MFVGGSILVASRLSGWMDSLGRVRTRSPKSRIVSASKERLAAL